MLFSIIRVTLTGDSIFWGRQLRFAQLTWRYLKLFGGFNWTSFMNYSCEMWGSVWNPKRKKVKIAVGVCKVKVSALILFSFLYSNCLKHAWKHALHARFQHLKWISVAGLENLYKSPIFFFFFSEYDNVFFSFFK